MPNSSFQDFRDTRAEKLGLRLTNPDQTLQDIVDEAHSLFTDLDRRPSEQNTSDLLKSVREDCETGNDSPCYAEEDLFSNVSTDEIDSPSIATGVQKPSPSGIVNKLRSKCRAVQTSVILKRSRGSAKQPVQPASELSLQASDLIQESLNFRSYEWALQVPQRTAFVITSAEPPYLIEKASQGFTQLTGYQRSFAMSRSMKFLQGAATSREVINKLMQGVAERRETSVTIVNYKRDQSMFMNSLTIIPVSNDPAKRMATHFLAVLADAGRKPAIDRFLSSLLRTRVTTTSEEAASEREHHDDGIVTDSARAHQASTSEEDPCAEASWTSQATKSSASNPELSSAASAPFLDPSPPAAAKASTSGSPTRYRRFSLPSELLLGAEPSGPPWSRGGSAERDSGRAERDVNAEPRSTATTSPIRNAPVRFTQNRRAAEQARTLSAPPDSDRERDAGRVKAAPCLQLRSLSHDPGCALPALSVLPPSPSSHSLAPSPSVPGPPPQASPQPPGPSSPLSRSALRPSSAGPRVRRFSIAICSGPRAGEGDGSAQVRKLRSSG
mmetsp:Transcript_14754/g.35052  ORF Transcript_14754/g.35052 Transcript_14754/m.35052 type:complete len:555 (-) Transcript_14754:236-1900(-)